MKGTGDSERSRGGKRWTRDDETHLLLLASEGRTAAEIASMMKRSYISVQHRLRSLSGRSDTEVGRSQARSFERNRFPNGDLTCGALSVPGHQMVLSVWTAIRYDSAIIKRNEPSRLRPEVKCVIGAIIRETMICSDPDHSPSWTRIAISRLRAKDVGVDSGVVRNLIRALSAKGFLEIFVGYIGPNAALQLDPISARSGRSVLLRAAQRTVVLCKSFGIMHSNLYTNFPSLRSDH